MTRRELVLAPLAEQDLRDLFDYVAADDPAAAVRLIAAVEEFLTRLADGPDYGVRRDDLAPGLRLLAFRRRITAVYVVTDDRLDVRRLLYRGRDVEAALRSL